MAKRKHESNGNGTCTGLHHFASDVVDCRDMIRVNRMSQPQAIREERRPEQNGMSMKSHDCPDP
jgi:hypothetical protein